jgi:hypothetical protein
VSSAAYLKQTTFSGNCTTEEAEWTYTLTAICYPFNATFYANITYDTANVTYFYFTDSNCTNPAGNSSTSLGACVESAVLGELVRTSAIYAIVDEIDYVANENTSTTNSYLDSNCSSEVRFSLPLSLPLAN